MILLIDNYDSFVYNIYQYAGSINPDIIVKRNDEITLTEIEKLNPERIILSPGPKKPIDAGICIDIVKNFEKATGVKVKYELTDRRPGDIAECYADPTKAEKELGWKAEKELEEMCRDSWRFTENNK